MSLRSFQLFAPLLQLTWVLKHDTYLARYWGNGGRGYVAEVRSKEVTLAAEVVRSFISGVLLEEYVSWVQLPVAL